MAHWSIPLDKLAEKIGLKMEKVVKMSTLYVFGEVVMRSPVDTGRFRANWTCTYGQPAIGYTRDALDKGSSTLETVASQIERFPVGGWMWLANSLPYAGVLEYGGFPNPPKYGSQKMGEAGFAIHVIGGYSMQAPQGMVRITAREFDAEVKRRISSI